MVVPRDCGYRFLCGIISVCLSAGFAPLAHAGRCNAEIERAAASSQAITREWSLRPADRVGDYFSRIGERLVSASGNESRGDHWRFTVVRNLASNAFSIGDGYIYIYEGALIEATSESEFAAVIAHEIGHQTAGHFCEPDPPATGSAFWSPFGWSPGGGRDRQIGSIVQRIDVGKEMEADMQAVNLLQKAGFDPHAMLRVARKFPKFDGASDRRNLQRINALKAILYDIPRDSTAPNSTDFSRYRNQLENRER